MARKTQARRYAEAVFQIALERQDFDRWLSDLKSIGSALSDPSFAAFLENPRFSMEQKNRLLGERLEGVNPLALNLVRLLIIKEYVRAAGDIVAEFERLVDRYRGIEQADIVTAVPLDEREKARIRESLGKLVDKQVRIKAEVDPSIIGGLIARIGGRLLDGSTRSRLMALKKQIAGAGTE
ncbi:MAG: ATP synthase F1 subunit delta [Chloroflexota bacterium]|nr:ATP synthase F1 subunit delta [Chloroflexota bacterium]